MKKLIKIVLLVVAMIPIFEINQAQLGANDVEESYTTSETITYTTPTFRGRANIIGTYEQYAPAVTVNNYVGWDLMNWTPSSTYPVTLTSKFYERFSTSFTGYKNIEFTARPQEAHGIEVSENIPSKQGLYYVFDYNSEQGLFLPVGNYGRSASGEIIENIHASNDRSSAVTLKENQMNANTPYEIEYYSFQDLNSTYTELTHNYNGYAYPISVDEKQPYVVAKLGDAKSAEIYYEREFTTPVEFYDGLKDYFFEQGIFMGQYKMTIKNMKWKMSAVKYSFDANLKVLDQVDQKVNAGESVRFASTLDTEFQGTVASDETLPISEQYFEISSDEGITWEKVSSDYVVDDETIRFVATPEMNDTMYRYVAIADDANKTKVASKPGKLEVESYTVNFHANTTDSVSDMPDTLEGVYPSAKITDPNQIPYRSGYTFLGWHSDANIQDEQSLWNFDVNVVLDNMTLYAKWEQNKSYVVDFVCDGGTSIEDQNVSEGQMATRPSNPTKDGYSFLDWYTDDTYTTLFDFTTPITEDTIVYGQFVMKDDSRVVVSFDSDGGSSIVDQNLEVQTLATRPSNPFKEGHMFVNWYTDSTYAILFDFTTPISVDTIIYGKFIKDEQPILEPIVPTQPVDPTLPTQSIDTTRPEIPNQAVVEVEVKDNIVLPSIKPRVSNAPKTQDRTLVDVSIFSFIASLAGVILVLVKRIERRV